MLRDAVRAKYLPTIGIECHVQLKTKTKLFAGVSNDAREAEPNTLISPVCLGLPGVLPVLNKAAVELAVRAGLALQAEIGLHSKFDRKHYFYPDLPKGYQITQFDEPIVKEGRVVLPLPDKNTLTVRIERAHLEEDAGKSQHPEGTDYSLVDLNRAGTPLLEIVSKPDIHTPLEAKMYAQELYLLMTYADVTEGDLYHGNMRFDVNVSVAPKDSSTLGTRAEIKNLNSFRAVEKATEYEINRQIELLEKGRTVIQETRGWDDAKQKTFSQRSKEDAHDYRYFPDPDLPPVVLTEQYVEEIKKTMPIMPMDIRERLRPIGLDESQLTLLLLDRAKASIVIDAIDSPDDAKRIANWFTGPLIELEEMQQKTGNNKRPSYDADALRKLSAMVAQNKLSSTAAKDVLFEMTTQGGDPEQIAESRNLIQMSDASAIETIVEQVIKENPAAADDVRSGETKAIGFLVGQVMKSSKGKANPQMAQTLLNKLLNTEVSE